MLWLVAQRREGLGSASWHAIGPLAPTKAPTLVRHDRRDYYLPMRLHWPTIVLIGVGLLVACAAPPISSPTPPVPKATPTPAVTAAESMTLERLAWSKQNLFDPETQTYYIPYQLWTGAYWDGNRDIILHSADTVFWVNGRDETRIKGPETWRHPLLDEEFLVYRRTKSNRDKVQLFIFIENVIGRVYDHRPTRLYDRYYDGKAVKLPAGEGWKIGIARTFSFTLWDTGRKWPVTTTIEITAIEFDNEGIMTALKYSYSVNGILDQKYIYSPGKGMVAAEAQ